MYFMPNLELIFTSGGFMQDIKQSLNKEILLVSI